MSDALGYATATATELAARIRRRALSPVEVVEVVIARIESRTPGLNETGVHRVRRSSCAGAEGRTDGDVRRGAPAA